MRGKKKKGKICPHCKVIYQGKYTMCTSCMNIQCSRIKEGKYPEADDYTGVIRRKQKT